MKMFKNFQLLRSMAKLRAAARCTFCGKTLAKFAQLQFCQSTKAKASPSLDAMNALKKDAVAMKEAILRGDLRRYADILRQSWEAKKKLAASISNPFLDAIYDDAIDAGALAGKISGAGGGGFFMFFVPPDKRMALVRRLQRHNGQVMNFHFTAMGAQSWVQAAIQDI